MRLLIPLQHKFPAGASGKVDVNEFTMGDRKDYDTTPWHLSRSNITIGEKRVRICLHADASNLALWQDDTVFVNATHVRPKCTAGVCASQPPRSCRQHGLQGSCVRAHCAAVHAAVHGRLCA